MVKCYSDNMFSVDADWYAIPCNYFGFISPVLLKRFPDAFHILFEFCSMKFMKSGIVLTVHNEKDNTDDSKKNLLFFPVSETMFPETEIIKSSLNRIIEIYKERDIKSIVFPKFSDSNINKMIINYYANINDLEVYITQKETE